MGFNWGAFAGALGNSALNTYKTLNEEQFRALQRAELEDQIKERKGYKQALADVAKERKY